MFRFWNFLFWTGEATGSCDELSASLLEGLADARETDILVDSTESESSKIVHENGDETRQKLSPTSAFTNTEHILVSAMHASIS